MKKPMPHRSNRWLSSIILLSLCAGLFACQPRIAEERRNDSPKTEGKRYELKGKVVSVDRAQQRVTISHEEIRGYMDAMTMPFTVKDTAIVPDISIGDAIQATVVVTDENIVWLEDVILTKPATKLTDAEQPTDAHAVKPGDVVPDFALVNQDGKPIRLRQFKGKTLLLTFIYTRCPLADYCPLMSNNFAEVDRELKKNAKLYDSTHLLSITIDPEYDTPKVLRSYGGAYTENYTSETFKHWEFATGTMDQVKAVAQFFGLTYYPEKDQLIHSLRTAIITPDGKVAKIYTGNEWKPAEALSDLQQTATSSK